MFHAFKDEHKEFFKTYQSGLERLSLRRPLARLNRNEQLAYWLNLYNVIVINKVIEEYPISKLKILRKDGKAFWSQKITWVEGVALSLVDIEQILIQNWSSPLVIYGLFQGSIGGPKLLREAYSGENVWRLLDENTKEFINSNRGVIPRKDYLEVSLFYKWTKSAFQNSDDVLLAHINAYMDIKFMGDISRLNAIKYKYYDWQVADLLGGNLYSGDYSNFASLVGAKTASDDHSIEMDQMLLVFATSRYSAFQKLPPQAKELIMDALQTNTITIRVPVITTLECPPGDPCMSDTEKK